MKLILISLSMFFCSVVSGQSLVKRVLFLGNSYTSANNLPQMIANAALSAGDSLIFDSNTPGGYRLKGHSTNSTSLAKIGAGNWDYVVLQEQSQFPSFPDSEVEAEVFPYARILDSMINAANPCAETVFYMTWGRKNGDASNCSSWPPVCTYDGMDSLLNLRYRMMADSNSAVISPVGAIWNYIRQNYPAINLYQADESHPSTAGTYAAAICFYTVLFRSNPLLVNFNSTLNASDASNIRNAVKVIVYDRLLNWHIGEYDPTAGFIYSYLGGGKVSFTNNSLNATGSLWDFGDGMNSTSTDPTHTYTATGTFNVKLLANKCAVKDSVIQTVNILSLDGQIPPISDFYMNIYPNPAHNSVIIKAGAKYVGAPFRVYDMSGRVIITGKIDQANTIIGLEKLPVGVYLFSIGEKLKRTFSVFKK